MLYMLTWVRPLGNERHEAQYYLGSCRDDRFLDRLYEHATGRGAAITRAVVERGMQIQVVCTWAGDYEDERSLKGQHNHKRIIRKLHRDGSAQFYFKPAFLLE